MATVSLTIPAATRANDLLWTAIVSFSGDSTQNPQPPGWTYVKTIQIQNGSTADIYTKVANGSDHGKSAAWTVTGSLVSAGIMLDIITGSTGEDGYTAAGYVATSLISTSPTLVSAANELAVMFLIAAANVNLSPPAPWSVVQQISGPQVSLVFAQQVVTAAGFVPSVAVDISPTVTAAFAATITFLGPSSLRAFTTA